MSELLNFEKSLSNCIWEDSKMQKIEEWSLQKDAKMLTFLKNTLGYCLK